MDLDIDVDKLILEVKKCPAIWNSKSIEYSDRFEKIKQWEEVVNALISPHKTVEEKKALGVIIQKKWRTVRDAFVKQRRELAIAAEKGTSIPEIKLYRYYKQLLFLEPVIGTSSINTSTSQSHPDQDKVIQIESDSEDAPHSSNCSDPPGSPPAKKMKNMNIIERELANVLKCTLAQKYGENDPDRQFMLSLVEDLKMVSPRLKSEVKMNILKCIMQAQQQEEAERKQINEGYTIITLPSGIKREDT